MTQAEDLWDRILAHPSLSSDEGRALLREAKFHLRALKPSFERGRARRLFSCYAVYAPEDLWPVAAKLPDPLVSSYIAAIEGIVDIEAQLLSAAYALGGAEGFRSMGELVLFASSGSDVPMLLKRAQREMHKFDSKTTRAACGQVLSRIKEKPSGLVVYGIALWYLVQQKKDPALILKLETLLEAWDYSDLIDRLSKIPQPSSGG